MEEENKEVIIVNLDRTMFTIYSLNEFIRKFYFERNNKIVFTMENYEKMLDKLEIPVDEIIYNDQNYYFNVIDYIRKNTFKKHSATFINPPKVLRNVLEQDGFNIVEIIHLSNY